MSFAHKLKYAGSEPFEPERNWDEITHQEMELLEQDEVYQRLAEVRWLADELESEVHRDERVMDSNAGAALFEAVAATDAPLQQMVDRYVAQWLAEHRADQEVEG